MIGGTVTAISKKPASSAKTLRRCKWAESDPQLCSYHDEEWGVPQHDSRALWEMLMLEGFQAGLSWAIILRKRDAFRKAFKNFDPEAVARFGEADVARLVKDPGIIRSRAKIEATIGGAQAYLKMHEAGEDFSTWVWDFVGGKADSKPRRSSCQDPVIRGTLQGAQEARLQICGPGNRLRVDAGGRNRQRPRALLLPAQGSRTTKVIA
jgi:DNA-3-methyladenine glycosylase I